MTATPRPKPAGQLTFTCHKCTRYAHFVGTSREEAGAQAERKGWALRNGKPICPRCPK